MKRLSSKSSTNRQSCFSCFIDHSDAYSYRDRSNTRITSIRRRLFGIMSHGNTTQQREIIEFISYTFSRRDFLQYWTMKPAIAKTPQNNSLEDLGRATLQIVHDLKNQLNGLKLYATFLRKRLGRDERSSEERETVMKLIAGLDRAARDMTALVRYSQPVVLHRQPHIDLRDLIARVIRAMPARPDSLTCDIVSN